MPASALHLSGVAGRTLRALLTRRNEGAVGEDDCIQNGSFEFCGNELDASPHHRCAAKIDHLGSSITDCIRVFHTGSSRDLHDPHLVHLHPFTGQRWGHVVLQKYCFQLRAGSSLSASPASAHILRIAAFRESPAPIKRPHSCCRARFTLASRHPGTLCETTLSLLSPNSPSFITGVERHIQDACAMQLERT